MGAEQDAGPSRAGQGLQDVLSLCAIQELARF
jgi:hypothetical protein